MSAGTLCYSQLEFANSYEYLGAGLQIDVMLRRDCVTKLSGLHSIAQHSITIVGTVDRLSAFLEMIYPVDEGWNIQPFYSLHIFWYTSLPTEKCQRFNLRRPHN